MKWNIFFLFFVFFQSTRLSFVANLLVNLTHSLALNAQISSLDRTAYQLDKSTLCMLQSLSRNTAIEVASTVKALYNETETLLVGRVSLVCPQGSH